MAGITGGFRVWREFGGADRVTPKLINHLAALGLGLVLLLGSPGPASARLPEATPPIGADRIDVPHRDRPAFSFPQGDFDQLTLPLKRAGNLFLIEAEIDSLRGNFILDLGAPYLVLNATYFREYEIDSSFVAGTFTSENQYVRRTSCGHLSIGELQMENLRADVTNLGNIENQRGVQILGLLGVGLFSDMIMELDLQGQQLILHRTPATLPEAPALRMDLPMKLRDGVLLVKGKVQGKKIRFSLDTGAEMNILDRDLPGEVFEEMEIQQRIEAMGADGTTAEVLVTQVAGYELGGLNLGKMRTLVANLGVISRAYGVQIDGVLGYPFFAQGCFVIDFKNERLQLYDSNGSQR